MMQDGLVAKLQGPLDTAHKNLPGKSSRFSKNGCLLQAWLFAQTTVYKRSLPFTGTNRYLYTCMRVCTFFRQSS